MAHPTAAPAVLEPLPDVDVEPTHRVRRPSAWHLFLLP